MIKFCMPQTASTQSQWSGFPAAASYYHSIWGYIVIKEPRVHGYWFSFEAYMALSQYIIVEG